MYMVNQGNIHHIIQVLSKSLPGICDNFFPDGNMFHRNIPYQHLKPAVRLFLCEIKGLVNHRWINGGACFFLKTDPFSHYNFFPPLPVTDYCRIVIENLINPHMHPPPCVTFGHKKTYIHK